MSYSGGEHFNKLAKAKGYRSRAAFKLHQIDKKFKLLKKGFSVMDLGSSPGGWSQVAKELVGDSGEVFALDIIPMKPINGVEFIEYDFRDKDIKKYINLYFNVVISDIAPNISGIAITDKENMLELLNNVTSFCNSFLLKGGSLIAKCFDSSKNELKKSLSNQYSNVIFFKPDASRKISKEIYVIAQNKLK